MVMGFLVQLIDVVQCGIHVIERSFESCKVGVMDYKEIWRKHVTS